MKEDLKESLSALIDDEMDEGPRARAVDRLLDSSDMRALWSRYHYLSDALTGRLPEQSAGDMADRIRCQLESEPLILAPRRPLRVLVKPLIGAAVAATVAVVAVLGVRGLDSGGAQPPAVAQAPEPGLRWDVSEPAVEARLNAYLVNHSEYLGNGMRGMLPYARIVGYDTEQ